ncbi:signal peptide-containing [Trichoderma cornu-damae]|uniref:Signal peptide-containing n=1 Tax=Trichoderma cornu-damae TaxID=654480 RepID=A0A9P8QXA6_9HYPO|nr:signal peptide-containing [Trichoderma cornu-damae]
MSFPVALQSAIFYLLACTPCAEVRHRHKAKGQAKKERVEKAKLETEQPGLYRHPSPFNTNPYWQEEIRMGPSLPKKSTSKNSSQRGLMSAGGEISALSLSGRTNTGDSRTNFEDSTLVVSQDGILSDDWNRRHGYQREDEELWGADWSGHKFKDALSKARDSAGRLIESTLGMDKEVTQEERRAFYAAPRNPPVNDFHPPVVSSKLPHKEAHKWMLQPPPSAKVMEGKVPVARAMSASSRTSGRTLAGGEEKLARQLQEKLVREKIMKDLPTESELIDSLFVTRTRSIRSDLTRPRSLSFDGSDEALDNSFDKRRRNNRLRALAAPPGYEESEDEYEDIFTPRITKSTSHSSQPGHAAQRPKLETITSSEGSNGRSRSKRSPRRHRSTRKKNLPGAGSPVGDDSD